MDSKPTASEPAIPWDAASEQPHVIRHRRSLRERLSYSLKDYLKAGLSTIALAPAIFAAQTVLSLGRIPSRWRPRSDNPADFMGLAVGLHSCEPEPLAREIRKLGVKHVLLRIPVWEIEQLDRYRDFMISLPEVEFVVCIMQDRAHVLDTVLWNRSLRRVVAACWPRTRSFQIGQGANRSKWGFFSGEEYLDFAAVAEAIRPDFPGIKLVGPNILDFETIPLVRGLAHGFPIRWDAVGCALYVDRRGSPRNRQLLFFDLKQKIYHFAACIVCSWKTARRFWITEVNWPIKDQGDYSPVREEECVSEEDAALYLKQYYEDAWDTKLVERVYWWQLVAKGFGLMDVEEDGSLRPRPAYHEFRKLLKDGFCERESAGSRELRKRAD